MSTVQPGGALWPADVIHVNEDGWVLINRGSRHGAVVGLRLLVVGTGIRDLHDLFAAEGTAEGQPPVARIRRTYEELEVVYAEDTCAIAIATRTPAARRPTVYRGPDGELLVWVPLPEGYTWPPAGQSASAADASDADDRSTATPPWVAEDEGTVDQTADDASDDSQPDSPPERAPQDDQPWEEALPLNSVSVGDIVVPAIPATASTFTPSASTAATTPTTTSDPHTPASPFEQGRNYDWMKKPGE